MELGEPIHLPTLALPLDQQYPTPALDLPTADIPSYKPLVVPPSDLRKPKKTKSKTKETTEQPPPPPKIEVPYFNFEVPLPTTESQQKVNKKGIQILKLSSDFANIDSVLNDASLLQLSQ